MLLKIAQNYSKQNIAVETEMLTFTQGARYYNYCVKPLIDIIESIFRLQNNKSKKSFA